MKINQVGRTLFREDKQNDGQKYRETNMTRLTVAFHTFAKATKKEF